MNTDALKTPKISNPYLPILAVFGTAALISIVTALGLRGFMGFALCILATLKLMDIREFAASFRKYDLITQRLRIYGTIYPCLELAIGLGFLASSGFQITGWGALLVGVSGVASVLKAVYIDRKSLHCACLGGNSKTPLGLISLLENTMMAGMGLMLIFNYKM
jgi:hypothetical protein